MTRKEALLVKKYELQNELKTLRGEEPLNLQEMTSGWRFREAVNRARVNELEDDIERLECAIEGQQHENEIKAKTEAFYATREGAAYKASLEGQLKECYTTQETLAANFEARLNTLIQNCLGARWAVKSCHKDRVDFGVRTGEDFIFGQDIEIYAEKNYWDEGERFELNVGTTGSFKLECEDPNARRLYYIDLGTFLADTVSLAAIKNTMFDYAEAVAQNRKNHRTLQTKLENPLSI